MQIKIGSLVKLMPLEGGRYSPTWVGLVTGFSSIGQAIVYWNTDFVEEEEYIDDLMVLS
tara:strand:- start:236 stop:412 length:177 start_codon:yes stop_codon:yes gene_type:complete